MRRGAGAASATVRSWNAADGAGLSTGNLVSRCTVGEDRWIGPGPRVRRSRRGAAPA
jgi:hypothetical protein